jgi:uncharacterized protein (TIGR03118 family)
VPATGVFSQTGFVQTNLVSDIPGLAQFTDPNLLNPWGISESGGSAFWISDNNSGFTTLYNTEGQPQPVGVPKGENFTVTIPFVAGSNPALGSPTGTVFNTTFSPGQTPGFAVHKGTGPSAPAIFLFATEDGLIVGWNPGVDPNNAVIAVDNSASGASYKGLAIGVDQAGQTLLYAANFAGNSIDVYDTNFHQVTTLKGNFTDPSLPPGYWPFNVQAINNKLYVEYALPDPNSGEGLAGPGRGFVDVYNTDGVLLQRLVKGGPHGDQHINAPWGVALAPASFGRFANDVLVGNFGNGFINAYDPNSGQFLGTLTLANGQPFQEDDLWALKFGNGGNGGNANTLYFTAGLNDQKDGLFGSLQAAPPLARNAPVLPNLATAAQQSFSTVAANGDVNPYGVAFVPQGFQGGGALQPGDLLVSNFNNAPQPDGSGNVQGTGHTIVQIKPDGETSTFFDAGQQLPGEDVGLTTALGVLKSGFVIVGNVPQAADGTVEQGSLIILDSRGNVVDQITDSALLNGPWDLTINDQGFTAQVFVSNVLSGTVSRLDLVIPPASTPIVESITQIASGYTHRTDPAALVVGPTGLAFDRRTGTLYVASTGDNAIFAVPNAQFTHRDRGTGRMIFSDATHLHGPLGLVMLPNGDLVAANGDAVNPDPNNFNELVEFTPSGKFVSQFQLDATKDSNGNVIPGAAFGLAVSTDNNQLRFAAVDDNLNAVKVFTFQQPSVSFTTQGGLIQELFALAQLPNKDTQFLINLIIDELLGF